METTKYSMENHSLKNINSVGGNTAITSIYSGI